jgi:hypothetical protein
MKSGKSSNIIADLLDLVDAVQITQKTGNVVSLCCDFLVGLRARALIEQHLCI